MALSRGGRAGRADGVPPLPRFHAPRPELAELRGALLDPGSGAVGVTGGVPGVGLAGQGGIGKTVLAAELAVDPDTAVFFPDGIYWVTVGERADPVTAQLDLLHRLGAGDTGGPHRAGRGTGVAGDAGRPAVPADRRRCVDRAGGGGVPGHRAPRPGVVHQPQPGRADRGRRPGVPGGRADRAGRPGVARRT